jgi:hypothetical protein
MPNEYYTRNLAKSELDIWKTLPFDGNYTEVYKNFMDEHCCPV